MLATSINSPAASFNLSNRSLKVSQEIQRLTNEMSSGKRTNIADKVGSSASAVARLDFEIRHIESLNSNIIDASNRAMYTQVALESIRSSIEPITEAVLAVGHPASAATLEGLGGIAMQSLDAVIGKLNTSIEGRSIFSGVNLLNPSTVNADEILSELYDAVNLTDKSLSAIIDTVAEYFSENGGFDVRNYLGSSSPLESGELRNNGSSVPSVTADREEIKEALAGLSLIIFSGDASIVSGLEGQNQLLSHSQEVLLGAGEGLVSLASEVGINQEQIDMLLTEIKSREFSLTLSREKIAGIDIFETAASLQAAELQLQTIFTTAARVSQLSLVNYI